MYGTLCSECRTNDTPWFDTEGLCQNCFNTLRYLPRLEEENRRLRAVIEKYAPAAASSIRILGSEKAFESMGIKGNS